MSGGKMDKKYAKYGPTILRIFLGLLLFVPGISKLMNPSGIIGMVSGLGFPVATLLGWLVIISEVLLGLTLIIGWKVKYTVWPLVIILTVATIFVVLPNAGKNPVNLLFHLQAIAGLISLYLTGPGAIALSK